MKDMKERKTEDVIRSIIHLKRFPGLLLTSIDVSICGPQSRVNSTCHFTRVNNYAVQITDAKVDNAILEVLGHERPKHILKEDWTLPGNVTVTLL